MEFLKQYGLINKVDSKALMKIHNHLTKETDSYDFITPEVPQKKPPGEREISFGAFVCALIQISNYKR